MGNSEALYFILLWASAVKPTSTTVTLTAYDGTGIVKQQPLILGCNYTKGGSDKVAGFDWRHGMDVIVSGSVTGQAARFQTGTGWESGVFLGDYASSLTIQLPASSVTQSIAGQYTCRISGNMAAQDTATATVQYAPQIESNFPSNKAVTEFSRLQINCSSYITPGNPTKTRYTWTYEGSTVSSGANLDINNFGRDRRGQYTCTVSNTVGSDSVIVDVDVQYATQIESTFPSRKFVTEFSWLQINCSSYTTPGNPPTTSYTWSHGGSTISSGAVLDIHNISRNKSGLYICTANNTVGSGHANVSVNVHFLDRPELLVNKTEVVENETVSLTCNVKSNPTAELAIRNVDNNTVVVVRDTNKIHFTIDRVQCLHNGSLLCTAGNPEIGNASYSRFTEINVKCSPRQDFRHKLDNIVVKQINETAALFADVIANPVPGFRWFRQESEGLTNISKDTIHSISNSRLQSVLYINISRTQDYGDYVLEMENSQGRKQLLFTLSSKVSTTLNVTAYDGTGIVKQQPLTLGCNYTKGGSDVITGFVWRHERDVILSGSVTGQIARFKPGTGWESGVFLGDFTSSLTIKLPASSVTPSVGGQYTCIMSSSVESVQDTATATVIYLNRPDLLLDKNEVIENETVSLTCNVESNPTAEMAIKNVDNDLFLVERDTNRLQFTIDRVQCVHNGSFLCTARNTQTGDLSTSVRKELIVLCSPRQDYRQALVQDVKCGLGDVAALAMHVIANPSPSFDWYVKKNQQLFPIPTSTEHSIVSSKQASVLQIQVENSRDYGMYAVTVENSIGRLQMTFTVSPVALPKPPNEVTVEDVTYNSITISWRSNDNGGASQTFNIEFRMMKGEWRLWSEGIVDPGIGKTQKSEIRSLQPGTQYEVLVFARNPYGQSAKVVREVTTYDMAPAIQGLGVGIGISVMIPVIIVILSLWCLWCRRDSNNRKRENIDSNELTLQQNSATGNQQNYTDMTMTESTVNEYEQLQVPPGQSKVYQNV